MSMEKIHDLYVVNLFYFTNESISKSKTTPLSVCFHILSHNARPFLLIRHISLTFLL